MRGFTGHCWLNCQRTLWCSGCLERLHGTGKPTWPAGAGSGAVGCNHLQMRGTPSRQRRRAAGRGLDANSRTSRQALAGICAWRVSFTEQLVSLFDIQLQAAAPASSSGSQRTLACHAAQ